MFLASILLTIAFAGMPVAGQQAPEFVLPGLLDAQTLSLAEKLIMVQPYEMEHFAQDKMRFTPLDSHAAFEEHINSIREASAGGSSGFQGGCGCR
jgi:hypothetical protein